jgi:hypothetical protein
VHGSSSSVSIMSDGTSSLWQSNEGCDSSVGGVCEGNHQTAALSVSSSETSGPISGSTESFSINGSNSSVHYGQKVSKNDSSNGGSTKKQCPGVGKITDDGEDIVSKDRQSQITLVQLSHLSGNNLSNGLTSRLVERGQSKSVGKSEARSKASLIIAGSLAILVVATSIYLEMVIIGAIAAVCVGAIGILCYIGSNRKTHHEQNDPQGNLNIDAQCTNEMDQVT